VPAVRAKDDIIALKMGADACRHRLLSDISMTGTVNQSTLMAPRELLLRLADELHRAIELQTEVSGHGNAPPFLGRMPCSNQPNEHQP
jgi:hypothetical protein